MLVAEIGDLPVQRLAFSVGDTVSLNRVAGVVEPVEGLFLGYKVHEHGRAVVVMAILSTLL